jgi:hypothetical protein
MPRLHITMPQDQYDELKYLAQLTGKKLATLAHQAIAEFLSDQTAQTRRSVRLAMRELDERRTTEAIEKIREDQYSR